MYLYFDKTGKLKEIINDDALRQGNYGVNTMYIYIDKEDVESIDVSYLLPSNLVVGPLNFDDTETVQIPFDAKRDLLYFKYYQNYTFFVIDLSEGDGEDDNPGNTALDEAGLVHASMTMNLTGGNSYALGDVNFIVETNAVLNQKYVASQEYMSLADYLYLRKIIANLQPEGFVPYTGATQDLNLGTYKIISPKISYSSFYIELHNESYEMEFSGDGKYRFYGDSGDIVFDTSNLSNSRTYQFPDKNGTLATTDDLPKKALIATFSTGDFTEQAGGNYAITDITVSNFISNSDMIVITWDNCFAICPLPVSGAGRVCAAMWNSNGEAQVIRIRYELKDSSTKLDISLQGGFTPPSNHTAYVFCYKLIS